MSANTGSAVSGPRSGDRTAGADAYATAQASAANLARLTGFDRHDVAVVLGSGWVPAADAIGAHTVEFDLDDLGGFSRPSVPGHVAKARSIQVGPVNLSRKPQWPP